MGSSTWKIWKDFNRKVDYLAQKNRYYDYYIANKNKEEQIKNKQLQGSNQRLKNKKKSEYAADRLEASYRQMTNQYHQCTVKDAKVYYPYKQVHSRHCGCNITNIKSRCHTI